MSWLLPPLPPTFTAALRDVHAQRPESRMAAAERLGRAEGDERGDALRGLSALAVDIHPGVRATALAALGMVGGEDEMDVIIAGLGDASPEVREFAALAAAQIGGDRAVACLVGALASPAPEVRFQAVAGIAELEPDDAASLLLPLLADADAEVRAQVISALANLEEPTLLGHIAGALDDDAPGVRLEAALALAAAGDARAERPLLEALRKRQRVAEVARALAAMDCRTANDQLAAIALAWLTAPHLRAEVGAALVELGDARGTVALRRVLTGLRPDVRSYAVDLARSVHAAGVLPELVRLARRPRGVDLLTLVEALAAFRDESVEARTALGQLAQRDDAVGEAATKALSGTKEGARP